MRRWRLFWIAGVSLALTACSIGRPMRQATNYIVDPPIGVAPYMKRRPETLRVGVVRVAAPYAGSALVYRLDDVRYETDPYNVFAADPGEMLGSQMADWLQRTGPFSHVIAPGSGPPAPYVLEVTVGELYGDFRAGRPPAAVVSAQLVLIEQTSVRPRVIYEQEIASRVPLQKASPDALVRGYGAALAEIISKAAARLSELPQP
jgi:cholesterol transport system auxiliary component